MKRINAIIFAVLFAIVLCACGASDQGQGSDNEGGIPGIIEEKDPETADTEKIKANFDKAAAYIESAADTSAADVQKDEEDPTNIYCYWNLDPDKNPFEPENELTVSGQKIVIGETTVGELEDMGFKIEKPADTIGPDEIMSVTLNKDGKYFLLELRSAEEEKPIDEAAVQGFTAGSIDYAIPYEYMGISEGTSFEEIIAALGMPNSYLNVNSGITGVSIEISYSNMSEEDGINTNTMFSLSFSYDPENNDTVMTSAVLSREMF